VLACDDYTFGAYLAAHIALHILQLGSLTCSLCPYNGAACLAQVSSEIVPGGHREAGSYCRCSASGQCGATGVHAEAAVVQVAAQPLACGTRVPVLKRPVHDGRLVREMFFSEDLPEQDFRRWGAAIASPYTVAYACQLCQCMQLSC
jgi:hypothetical protein